jgi:hypothetical protein
MAQALRGGTFFRSRWFVAEVQLLYDPIFVVLGRCAPDLNGIARYAIAAFAMPTAPLNRHGHADRPGGVNPVPISVIPSAQPATVWRTLPWDLGRLGCG